MTMFSQDQVNQWFSANPNATPEQVAQTVQGLGGLDANQGLAGLIGQHYGTDANTIVSNYNTLAAPATPATPVDYSALVNNAYSGIGRTGVGSALSNIDQGGLDYWTGQLKSGALTPESFQGAFNNAVTTYAQANPTDQYTQYVQDYQTSHPTTNQYFVNNPDVAAEYARNNQGMTPDQFATTHYNQFGVNEQRLDPNALSGVAGLYQTYLGRAPESRSAVDAWASRFGSTIEADELAAFRQAALPELRNTGYLSDPFKTEAKSYISSVLGDTTLTPQQQAANIMAKAKEAGLSQTQLEGIYGKGEANPYLDVYKTGITSFLTDTLAKDPGTTMSEVGEIHRAAQEFGLSPADLAKYGGLDPKVAQAYFDMYDKGLGTLVASLNDPKVTDVQKTATLLSASKTYGTTDEELAKASNGKYTTAEVKAYLDPVRNVPTNFQKIMNDPNASAADITKFVTEAKKDPRAAGIYGAALDKATPDPAYLALRDINNGTGSLAENYNNFLTAAKSTPELAAKYAPQIAQAEKMVGTAMFSANEVYGGKPQDYQLQIVSKLPAKELSKIPKQLDMTPAKIETRTGSDEGGEYKYNVEVPATVKSKDVVPIGGGSDWEGGSSPITGYRSTKPTTINGSTVYATWDENGKITGYEGDSRQRSWLNGKQSISGNWDANGNPKPTSYTSKGGGLRGEVNSIMSDPILGSLANVAASYFGGPLGVAALAAVQGVPPEEILKRAAISMVANEVGGQVTGAAGGAGGALGEFGSQAAGQFAGNAAAGILSGQDLDTNGLLINSLINAGLNTGGKDLLGLAGLDKLGAAQPYVNNVLSGAVSGAITGKDQDIAKTITNTALKEAMKSGKETLKTAAKS